MNISEYKKAMKEIHTDTHKIKSRFENTLYQESEDKKIVCLRVVKRPLFICIVSFLLIAILIPANLLTSENNSDFSLTVYAANENKELILSDTSVSFSASNQYNMQGITNDEKGTVNFDLRLKCEGNDIESVTYKLSDEIITKENRGKAVAWFVENDSYMISDSPQNTNDKSVWEFYRDSERVYELYKDDIKYYLTRMIGSTYSVSYDNQQDKNYGIAINFNKNDKGEFIAEDFIIAVDVLLNDGTSLKRYIEVETMMVDYKTSNDFPKIQMTLKD